MTKSEEDKIKEGQNRGLIKQTEKKTKKIRYQMKLGADKIGYRQNLAITA